MNGSALQRLKVGTIQEDQIARARVDRFPHPKQRLCISIDAAAQVGDSRDRHKPGGLIYIQAAHSISVALARAIGMADGGDDERARPSVGPTHHDSP